jgi:hypothetical protein
VEGSIDTVGKGSGTLSFTQIITNFKLRKSSSSTSARFCGQSRTSAMQHEHRIECVCTLYNYTRVKSINLYDPTQLNPPTMTFTWRLRHYNANLAWRFKHYNANLTWRLRHYNTNLTRRLRLYSLIGQSLQDRWHSLGTMGSSSQ